MKRVQRKRCYIHITQCDAMNTLMRSETSIEPFALSDIVDSRSLRLQLRIIQILFKTQTIFVANSYWGFPKQSYNHPIRIQKCLSLSFSMMYIYKC